MSSLLLKYLQKIKKQQQYYFFFIISNNQCANIQLCTAESNVNYREKRTAYWNGDAVSRDIDQEPKASFDCVNAS